MEPEDNANSHGVSGCIVTTIAVVVILFAGGSVGVAFTMLVIGGIFTGVYALMKSG